MSETDGREQPRPLEQDNLEFQEQVLELLDRAGLIIVALRDDASISYVNRSGAEMLGWERSELTGSDWFDCCLPPDNRESVREVYRAAVDGEDFARVFQNEIARPDGTRVNVLWYNTTLRDENGHLITTLSIGQDIDELTDLREARERLERIIETSSDVIAWATPDGTILYLNPGGLELLGGGSTQEITGRNMSEFHSPQMAKVLLEEAVPMAIDDGEWRGEIPVKAQDGREVPMSWTIVPQFKDGRIDSFSVIARDISEQVADRERIDALNQELTEVNSELESALLTQQTFLANVSHELRTPLNSIIGFTGIMREGMAGPVTEEQQRQLDMVYASSTRLLRLINQILDLSKIEADSVTATAVEFDLADLMARVAAISRPMIQQSVLQLTLDLESQRMPVFQDDLKLEQIILNLISNAIRHTEVGEISLAASSVGEDIRITVSDTGAGIPEEDLPRVFNQFYQAPQASRRKTEGTGLGLSIAKELAELIGGTLVAESTVGKGTTFTLTVPRHLNAD